MHNAALAIEDLVALADAKIANGTMARSHVLLPTVRRLRRWLASVFRNDDGSTDDAPELLSVSVNVVYLGDGFSRARDPEHLPPTSNWQRFGNRLRAIPHFFGSNESIFAVRCACATMSIGIVAFLENTRVFFLEQRLVWAMIIVAVGMTMTSGQSLFGFACRIGGTTTAMLSAYVAWYIVDGHTAGVIVFAWLFLLVGGYFIVKFPRLMSVWITATITMILILGYELQVLKIGRAAAERTGQPAYEVYLLAPYRLATVAGGCFVGFIWTIFPSPLTDRQWLRRDLSAALYLLANFFSVVNQSLKVKLHRDGGDEDVPDTPAARLLDARRTLFGKLVLLLPSLEAHAAFQRWEPDIGGRFPREIYEDIIRLCTRVSQYLSLTAQTIGWPQRRDDNRADGAGNDGSGGDDGDGGSEPDGNDSTRSPSDLLWLQALSRALHDVTPTQHAVVSTLALLSNSVRSGQALPPFLALPRPYELARQIAGQGPEARALLSASNMEQPGYAEFAVLQVCSTLIYDDLRALIDAVTELVGTVDFSFKVEPSETSLAEEGSGSSGEKGKRKAD